MRTRPGVVESNPGPHYRPPAMALEDYMTDDTAPRWTTDPGVCEPCQAGDHDDCDGAVTRGVTTWHTCLCSAMGHNRNPVAPTITTDETDLEDNHPRYDTGPDYANLYQHGGIVAPAGSSGETIIPSVDRLDQLTTEMRTLRQSVITEMLAMRRLLENVPQPTWRERARQDWPELVLAAVMLLTVAVTVIIWFVGTR